jgi:hypothetical protein
VGIQQIRPKSMGTLLVLQRNSNGTLASTSYMDHLGYLKVYKERGMLSGNCRNGKCEALNLRSSAAFLSDSNRQSRNARSEPSDCYVMLYYTM